MNEKDKSPVAVLVIGTCHEYQRHQDRVEEREKVRADFGRLLRRTIVERAVNLIAEEAGDDKEAFDRLKADEAKTPPELQVLFVGTEGVDVPQSTIAKLIADEHRGSLTHVDIRPLHADEMTIDESDDAMAAKVMEILGPATSVLVICGKKHRAGLSSRLQGRRLDVKSQYFPQ